MAFQCRPTALASAGDNPITAPGPWVVSTRIARLPGVGLVMAGPLPADGRRGRVRPAVCAPGEATRVGRTGQQGGMIDRDHDFSSGVPRASDGDMAEEAARV